jgi:hypothetical protein
VRFSGGDNLAESTADDSLCDSCRTAEATIWCVNDAAKLCDACDAACHGRNAVLARHERLPLVDARALMEFCPEHGEHCRFEYYCRECHTSLCTKCKMAGSHSRGAKAEHALVPIRDAYAEALAAMDAGDPIVNERRAVIAAKQSECDAMLQDVIANVEQVEEDIRQIVAETINQERECAGDKTLVIRSVQTELRRKLAEVVALERSLDDCRRVAGPQAFLRAVTSQARVVARSANNLDLPLEVTAQGDVLVHGAAVLDPVLVRSRSRKSRCRSRGFEKVAFAEIEQEVIELNRWIRSILPEFTDLRTELELGVPLIDLLRVIQPDKRPSVPYPTVPTNAAEAREARAVAVQFARELGARGNYDESVLVVRGEDPTRIVRFLRLIQRDVAGVNRETSAGLTPRRGSRSSSRERAVSPAPPN